MNSNKESNEEWISVSQLAVQLGVSSQTIYNRIQSGVYQAKVFRRGTMRGLLVLVPHND